MERTTVIKHTNKLIAYRVNGQMTVFQLKGTIESVPPVDHHKGPPCLCCQSPMVMAFDVQQMGFWEDAFKTYFACHDCGVAVAYDYRLSHIEPVKQQKSKKASKAK